MMAKTTKSILAVLLRGLGTQRSVRIAMIAAAAIMALGVVFVLLNVYFVTEERSVARAQANAVESVRLEASGNLLETANHLEQLRRRLAGHTDGAAPFRLIEEHLDPEVGFSSMTIDYRVPNVQFSVHAPNVGSIARQVAAFENDKRIFEVHVSPLSRNAQSSRYEATMTITLDPIVLLAFPKLSDQL